MLTFSDSALAVIEEAMTRRGPVAGLRLGVAGSPCAGLKYIIRLEETPAADDQQLEVQGLRLLVDNASLAALQGVRVDYLVEGERRGFTFESPMPTGCSGCTKSASAA